MSRFSTLMRREWMQHHRAWLLIVLLPPALVCLLLVFGRIDLDRPAEPLLVVLFTTAGGTFGVLAIFALATVMQLPGLARRDRQDRSEEFWLSLPVSHSASIGATLAMHLLLMPLFALAVGYLFSQAIALIATSRISGLAAWAQLPWSRLIVVELLALLETALGVAVAVLWLAPILLLTMAASAWLKRWGTAALAVALSLGHAVLARLYGISIIGDTLRALVANAARSLLNDSPAFFPRNGREAAVWLDDAPRLFLGDAAAVLANLAQPLFLFTLLFSAACFGLLVLRRSRQS